jgi:hypothetical protein
VRRAYVTTKDLSIRLEFSAVVDSSMKKSRRNSRQKDSKFPADAASYAISYHESLSINLFGKIMNWALTE